MMRGEIPKVDLAALLRLAQTDPRVAEKLRELQTTLRRRLLAMIDAQAAAMAPAGAAALSSTPSGPATSFAHVAGSAKRRQRAARRRRMLAGGLVMQALKNLDNPDWDPAAPLDGSSSASPTFLMTLLQMPL